jgi:hypothetical protein
MHSETRYDGIYLRLHIFLVLLTDSMNSYGRGRANKFHMTESKLPTLMLNCFKLNVISRFYVPGGMV